MPKKINPKELSGIVTAVSSVSGGLTIADIEASLDFPIDRRTLQRRLTRLINDGLICRDGKGKAIRYLAVRPDASNRNPIPLSKSGREVFGKIQQPLHMRSRVSYKRSFLDEYDANRSAYLHETLLRHLKEIGQLHEEIQPAGTYARKILDRLLVDLSFNSSRLEGNTYSLLETKQLIEQGMSARGRKAEETQMILNHKAAIELLVESVEESSVSRRTILNLHALLSDNLLGDPAAGGRLRKSPVTIGSSSYLPNEVPQVIEECFNQIIRVVSQIEEPFEQCFFMLVHLPYLQPFDDVNKRVSRLSANIPLIRNNLRPLSFVDVSKDDYTAGLLGVYELNRIELLRDVFVYAYERSAEQYAVIRESLGNPDEFRLQYRSEIKSAVAEVVINLVPAGAIAGFVAKWVKRNIPGVNQSKFIGVVEAELAGLHEGNYARYPITPSQYDAWASL